MAGDSNSDLTVLFITNNREEYTRLRGMIAESHLHLETHWKSPSRGSLRAALTLIETGRIPIVLCEHTAGDTAWRDLLERTAGLPDSPYLIVTSRTADEQLWSEALNLGAYDVLATPFNPEELGRVLSSALARWKDRADRSRAKPAATLSAGR